MESPERLNVLLSRARNGLVLIGNLRTFCNSKKGGALWKKFHQLLKDENYIYDGFPVKCEKHPTRIFTVKEPQEFDSLTPDGGCTEPW